MKNKFYIWASDLEIFRGEGILAQLFISEIIKYNKNSKILLESFNKKIIFKNNKKKIIKDLRVDNLNFYLKYVLPIIGSLKCRYYKIKNYNVVYVNYLPLWNFLIFFFLPKKTILGPITGGAEINQSINFFSLILRKYFFPFFYKFSIFFLYSKNNLLFSTSLLINILPKKILKKSIFDFALKNLKPQIIKKKKIEFIIYYRNHPNKKNDFIESIVKYLVTKKIPVKVIGDFFNHTGVTNYGNCSRKKTKKLIQNAGYAINTGENPLSLFALDCLSLHTTLFIEKKMINSKFKNIKKLLVPINFKNTKLSKNKIIRYIKKNKLQFHSRDFSNLKKISKNFNEEFKSYLKKNF